MTKFKKTKSKILVTSALPYANGSLHLGHLVEYIQTDIFVRFLRLTGNDVIYVCADDAHGAPIEIKSEELGKKPEEFIAQVYKEHVNDFKKFLISFDNYYTTHSKENEHYSNLIFERLKENGFIYTKDIETTFCENCKRTLPDRYVRGTCPRCDSKDQYGDVCESCNATYKTTDLKDPYCAICKKRPVRKTSKHYFFRLSQFSDKLDKWLKSNKNLQPEIKNYIFGWINNGLEDWNISRDGPYFGFKIPGEDNKFFYVWLDAPIGYISSTDNYCKKHGLKTEDYWNNKSTKIYHFIGKDIIYFHFLFWPAMLLGSGFELPHDIVVHGFLTVNGEKMSKSRGTFLTAKDFYEKHEPEHLRFYYASFLSKALSDIDLNLNDFRNKINNELAANIGNLCYRVLNFLNKNFDGYFKNIDDNKALINEIKEKAKDIEKNYNELNLKEAVKGIMHISSSANKYFQENEPWKLIKEDREKVQQLLGLCINIIKNVSILLQPIMPEFSKRMQQQLNLENLTWGDIGFSLKNHKIGKEEILVHRVEEKEEKKIFPLNLKVARVLEVKDHPNAEKLYLLDIDLGAEKRKLVAGLKQFYSKDELKGKKIIVISNLKYAKLRGEESQGMLLAADDGKEVGVLTVEKSEPGDKVFIEGYGNSTEQVTFEEFQKIKIVVENGKVKFENLEFKTADEFLKAEKLKNARVR